jgi:hypothetical protein
MAQSVTPQKLLHDSRIKSKDVAEWKRQRDQVEEILDDLADYLEKDV